MGQREALGGLSGILSPPSQPPQPLFSSSCLLWHLKSCPRPHLWPWRPCGSVTEHGTQCLVSSRPHAMIPNSFSFLRGDSAGWGRGPSKLRCLLLIVQLRLSFEQAAKPLCASVSCLQIGLAPAMWAVRGIKLSGVCYGTIGLATCNVRVFLPLPRLAVPGISAGWGPVSHRGVRCCCTSPPAPVSAA